LELARRWCVAAGGSDRVPVGRLRLRHSRKDVRGHVLTQGDVVGPIRLRGDFERQRRLGEREEVRFVQVPEPEIRRIVPLKHVHVRADEHGAEHRCARTRSRRGLK